MAINSVVCSLRASFQVEGFAGSALTVAVGGGVAVVVAVVSCETVSLTVTGAGVVCVGKTCGAGAVVCSLETGRSFSVL